MSVNKSQKEDTGKKSRDLLFSENQFCSLSVWDLLRLTPWVFWSEIFTSRFVSVSFEFWLRCELQIRPTRFAINFYSSLPGLKGRLVCVRNCLIFFVGEYSSVWPEISGVFSQTQWRFLLRISGKNYFRRIFQKFCANQGYPLPKLMKFRPTFCNFILGPYCA